MMLLKKNVYYKLAAKVDHIDTNNFVLKTKYDTEKSKLEKKIPDTSDLVKKKQIIILKLLNEKAKFLILVI